MRRASPHPHPAYQSSPSSTMPPGQGKTSQVIERLTAENDRLRRELNAEKAAKDEALQQQRVLKTLVHDLEEQNLMLKHQFDTHHGALTRKERRMDDLKTTLEQEVNRRKSAEERETTMGRKLDEVSADAAGQIARYKGAAKAAETAYATMSKEFLELRGRVEVVRDDFIGYRTESDRKRKEHSTLLVRLEILLDQKRQAVEQSVKANREQTQLLDEFKAEFLDLRTRRQEMIETTKQMRWVMGLHKARNGDTPSTRTSSSADESPG
jgi:chromosome segregation ATPase